MISDWIDIFKLGDIMREEANVKEVFEMMIGYLEMQEKNFGINLSVLIDRLKESGKLEEDKLWREWIEASTTSYE